MSYHQPRVFVLKGSVGSCGTNNPEDVKILQHMINSSGYKLSTGRSLNVSGKCDAETEEAIIWYQRLLALTPSGLVHPVDSSFLTALENARQINLTRQSTGPLKVKEGQVTFDYEGVDYITAREPFRQQNYPYFSRILHWPPKFSSGVTLGRGYDMGSRSPGEIFATLRQAGLEEYKCSLCSRASLLKGRQAGQFVKVYGPLVGEITHIQQIRLFEIAYGEKLNYSKGVYSRNSKHIDNALSWNALDKTIKDVFVDTLYQGNKTAPEMVRIMAGGGTREDIIKYLKNAPLLNDDTRRTNLRIRMLQQ